MIQVTDSIEIVDIEFDKTILVTITIKLVGTISMQDIFDYMQGGTSCQPPQSCIQAMDIALRSKPALVK